MWFLLPQSTTDKVEFTTYKMSILWKRMYPLRPTLVGMTN